MFRILFRTPFTAAKQKSRKSVRKSSYTTKSMKIIAHDCFERGEDFITRTMAGEELSIGIFGFQPLSQSRQF